MAVDCIENSAAIGHPHTHGSDPLISIFVAHIDTSFLAVIAAGNRRSAPSALGLPVEGKKTPHRTSDRLLWSNLAKVWSQWREALYFVQPRTVALWQQKRFRDYWRALSQRGCPGRPKIAPALRSLIRRMWRANPTWGSPGIVAELQKLEIEVAKSTVEKYKPRGDRLPSATRRTFLYLHLKELVAVDFFIVPTATFKVLFVFLVFAHDRRRILHFNVTEHPPLNGRPSNWLKRFPSIRHRVICCGTAMPFTVTRFGEELIL